MFHALLMSWIIKTQFVGNEWTKSIIFHYINSKLTVDSCNEFLQQIDSLLDSWLGKSVVVLYAIQQFGKTPKRICL